MRRLLVLYWLVYATAYSVAYTGPFEGAAVCNAAKSEAMVIEPLPYDCVTAAQYDDYLMDASLYRVDEYGGMY